MHVQAIEAIQNGDTNAAETAMTALIDYLNGA